MTLAVCVLTLIRILSMSVQSSPRNTHSKCVAMRHVDGDDDDMPAIHRLYTLF